MKRLIIVMTTFAVATISAGCAHGGGAPRLHVEESGPGHGQAVPVIFLHGLAGSAQVWQAQVEHLRSSRRVLAYDARGHGQSPPTDQISIALMAEDLGRVAREAGLTRFVLVGHSMAGLVMTAYLAQHPEQVAGAVFVDAVGDFSKLPPGAFDEELAELDSPAFGQPKMQQAFEGMLGKEAKPATRAAVQASLLRMPPAEYAALWKSMIPYRVPQEYFAYRGPQLAVVAEVSAKFPIGIAAINPAVPIKIIPGVSHWIMLDDPDSLNALLDQFLSEVK